MSSFRMTVSSSSILSPSNGFVKEPIAVAITSSTTGGVLLIFLLDEVALDLVGFATGAPPLSFSFKDEESAATAAATPFALLPCPLPPPPFFFGTSEPTSNPTVSSIVVDISHINRSTTDAIEVETLRKRVFNILRRYGSTTAIQVFCEDVPKCCQGGVWRWMEEESL
jgi:hypothetical protein